MIEHDHACVLRDRLRGEHLLVRLVAHVAGERHQRVAQRAEILLERQPPDLSIERQHRTHIRRDRSQHQIVQPGIFDLGREVSQLIETAALDRQYRLMLLGDIDRCLPVLSRRAVNQRLLAINRAQPRADHLRLFAEQHQRAVTDVAHSADCRCKCHRIVARCLNSQPIQCQFHADISHFVAVCRCRRRLDRIGRLIVAHADEQARFVEEAFFVPEQHGFVADRQFVPVGFERH